MVDRAGPDRRRVLLSYAIFNAATGGTMAEHRGLCEARRTTPGELHGDGMATTSRTRLLPVGGRASPCGWTWHNYALCRWLAFRDSAAEEMFVRAIQGDPHNKVIRRTRLLLSKIPEPAGDVVGRRGEGATAGMSRTLKLRGSSRKNARRSCVPGRDATCRWRRQRQFFNEVLGRDKEASSIGSGRGREAVLVLF